MPLAAEALDTRVKILKTSPALLAAMFEAEGFGLHFDCICVTWVVKKIQKGSHNRSNFVYTGTDGSQMASSWAVPGNVWRRLCFAVLVFLYIGMLCLCNAMGLQTYTATQYDDMSDGFHMYETSMSHKKLGTHIN